MTYNDSEHLNQIRYRWQKEQQLIRKKYQIPYNMTYISKQCFRKPISITSQIKSLLQNEQLIITRDNLKEKIVRLNKSSFNIKTNDLHIPPIYCSKCHLYPTECSCPNGLGHWWINLQKKSHSTDETSSIHERHVSFNSSLIDFSSQQIMSKYVLLDWNNRQSLMDFIRTTNSNENLSTMTIEQLRKLLTKNDHIHIFNSIIDLIISMNKEQLQAFFSHIYIDPSYYSTIQGIIPLSQSQFIADNINLNRTLYTIQQMAILLGIKIDPSIKQEKISTKQRQSILHEQTLFIASKIPYNRFRNLSVHTQ